MRLDNKSSSVVRQCSIWTVCSAHTHVLRHSYDSRIGSHFDSFDVLALHCQRSDSVLIRMNGTMKDDSSTWILSFNFNVRMGEKRRQCIQSSTYDRHGDTPLKICATFVYLDVAVSGIHDDSCVLMTLLATRYTFPWVKKINNDKTSQPTHSCINSWDILLFRFGFSID